MTGLCFVLSFYMNFVRKRIDRSGFPYEDMVVRLKTSRGGSKARKALRITNHLQVREEERCLTSRSIRFPSHNISL